MESDQGYSNPFGAFSGLNIDIDNGTTTDEIKLLEQNDDELADMPEALATTNERAGILSVRPTERQDISDMTHEEVATELTAYDMPEHSLQSLKIDTQARLLESFRHKQDVTEFQTIGAMQVRGEILPPQLLAASKRLEDLGLTTELLTPGELVDIKRFTEYRPEDTDTKLHIILDIITQSKNGVYGRRDFSDPKTVYYSSQKSERLEEITDKINDYLDNGGYSGHEIDPEYVSQEERDWLADEYGNDPVFRHCNRSELIELGYLAPNEPGVIGPLDDSDLSFINSVVAPTFASKVSERSIGQVANYFPSAARFYRHSDRVSDFETALLGKYVEEEVANNRTLDPKALVCGFLAFEKEFFESGFTERVEEYLAENPNASIKSTLMVLRRKLMYGGRYCNILTGGNDKTTREKYKTMLSTSSKFLDEVLKKAEDWTDIDAERKLRAQSAFIVKLDAMFEEARIAYSGLKAIIETPQQQNDTPENVEEDKPKGISTQSVHRILETNARIVDDAQFTGEADIRMPDNPSE